MDNPMYNAILKWSLAQIDTSDPNRPAPPPMDPEKQAFLDKVLAEMVEDEAKSMKELIESMQGPEETLLDVQRKEEAMEDLLDRIDKIDAAINLHSLNGLIPAIRLAGTSKHGGVRALAADIVALAVKNNEKCQQWAMEGGALQAMMALHLGIVAGEDGAAAGVGDGEKAKALSAIAALVQNFAPAERQFLAADGATLLRDALAPGRPARLRARAAFFMQWLLRDSPPARAAALATHAVPNLALASADAANADVAEHAAAALAELCAHDAAAVKAALPEGVGEGLRERVSALEKEGGAEAEAVACARGLIASLGL